jgi:hypothetical protein
MNRFFAVVAIFLVSIIATPFVVQAQAIGFDNEVTILTIPEYPKPFETMTLKARSFSTDLDIAQFNWIVNGKTYKQGTGVKDISVTMGKPGTLTVVSVVIKTKNGQTTTQTFSFRPADVTLLWEADTYKPPFYRGHTTAAFGSTFRITAIPEFFDKKGVRMNPKDLVYTWKKNYEIVGEASGYGKDSFITTKTGYLDEDENISVEVSSPRESVIGSTHVTISPTTPKVLFYENNPALGVLFNKELGGSVNTDASSIDLFTAPFGMSQSNRNNPINIDWSSGNTSLTDFLSKRFITIDNRLNLVPLSVQFQSTKKLLQSATGQIVVSFTKSNE